MIPDNTIELHQKTEHRPSLLFDRNVILSRILALRKLQLRFNCRFLLSVKAFPDDRVLQWFVQSGVGFDASNVAELRKICIAASNAGIDKGLHVSLSGPLLAQQGSDLGHTLSEREAQLEHVTITVSSMDEAARLGNIWRDSVRLGLRLRATPPEFETRGWFERHSRFGLGEPDVSVSSLASDISGWCGLHVHYGAEQNSRSSLCDAASRMLEFASRTGISLRFMNFGGGLLGWSEQDIVSLLIELRKVVPDSIELVFEPGAFWFQGAGFAVCHVMRVDPLRDGIQRIVVNLSAESHLKWSAVRLCLRRGDLENRSGTLTLVVYGASCYEKDLIGVFRLPNMMATIRADDLITFSGVSSYSAAWNTSFNGVPSAEIQFFDGEEATGKQTWLEFGPSGAYGKVWMDFERRMS